MSVKVLRNFQRCAKTPAHWSCGIETLPDVTGREYEIFRLQVSIHSEGRLQVHGVQWNGQFAEYIIVGICGVWNDVELVESDYEFNMLNERV